MKGSQWIGAAIAGLALLAISGCSDTQSSSISESRRCIPTADNNNCGNKLDRVTTGSLGDTFGTAELGNLTVGSGEPLGRGTSVNKHLWLASLDTLSFLPIASTDPFTGVIATDWSSAPNAPNERLKVTAFVKNTSLTADALQVAVYREQLADNGVWIAVPVDAKTPRQLEDAILTRARQLRRDELEAEEG